jgi:hypothetical protein
MGNGEGGFGSTSKNDRVGDGVGMVGGVCVELAPCESVSGDLELLAELPSRLSATDRTPFCAR